ncbi:transposase [Bilifractor sp. HCP3S3_D3]|uniref:transposase n=1 Tax=Bilifractor sp. HCP3S3_D3 TaxID=3438907 RepID=UPI003F8C59CD
MQMLTQNADKKREQIQMFCMDDLVPQDHLLRLIDKSIDWSFIYDLVEEKYSPDQGRPSIDPVMLIKIPLIQYLYGIKSMRQTIKEIDVNVAYRWFLGLDMYDKVPHFSTFGKNYTRRFQDTDLFEQIFLQILSKCYKYKLVDPNEIFIDSTHVKARANNKKWRKKIAEQETLFYQQQLQKEIQEERDQKPEMIVMDADYKTPAIAKLLLDDGIKPLFPYKRPMTKKGFSRKNEYVYDEAYDCYICPNYEILKYSTTNREGYREYKSNPSKCRNCPYLSQCTESRNYVKLVTRHVWEDYMETCEDIRYTIGMKEVYQLRKETIERIFGTAKENHGFRYTQMYGKARMNMKVGLTFACMNLKKLTKMFLRKRKIGRGNPLFLAFHSLFPSEFCFT